MKFLVFAICLAAAATAVPYEDILLQEFNLFKAQYQKSYENPLENFRRFEVFLQNKYDVAQHNLRYRNGEETYEQEINKYGDWFPEEIAMLNGVNKDLRERAAAGEDVVFPEFDGEMYKPRNTTVPDSMNWVDKGVVSPVKDQGKCGSCYAFSAIGALESQQYMKTKKMVRLSEQEIIDCSFSYGNSGCKGGSTDSTYKYVKGNGGINTESSYPYEGKVGTCRHNKTNNGATCSGYVGIAPTEEDLKIAVAEVGPASACINAMNSFVKYKSGIYSDPQCDGHPLSVNHAILVVGYGIDADTKQPYWLVKNSWGSDWGDRGYIKMARNKNNMCGIGSYAIYPTI